MSFDLMSLVTDRTAADVAELSAAIQRILNGKGTAEDIALVKRTDTKGGYHHTDLNRVTSAIVYLKDLYEQYGYQVDYTPVNITHSDGTTDTTWRVGETPTAPQGAQIMQNILALWVVAESAVISVANAWVDNQFGYVYMLTPVTAGDYIAAGETCGVVELTLTVKSTAVSGITATGTGWTAEQTADDTMVVRYRVPGGAFPDIQDALDQLVFLCFEGEYAKATVTLSASMRSGNTIQLGSGVIRWSDIINWKAFEAYGYTWQDVEDRELTWEGLEALPMPEAGGTA